MTAKDTRYFWQSDDPQWYKDAVIYELHVRAFMDSNGDGIGDFPGLAEKLDYLQDLGVTAIWLLPFYPSPFRDDGYDIADYASVHPTYGTLRNVKDFIREANYRGLRVITELVLNHTSDQHPWFQRARRAAPSSRYRDYYVWSQDHNRYREARVIFQDFEASNWSWDPVAKSYYWHRFYSHQPDLNYDSPLVRQAMLRVVNFWLGMGVSGLRLDAVPYLYERDGTNCENLPETLAFLKQLRTHIDERFANRMLLAEANQWADDAVAYFGDGDECHMAYHFPLMPRMFMAIRMEDRFPIIDILRNTPPIPESCQWALFLRNHDELTLEMVTDEERDYMYRVFAYDTQARINLGIRRRLAPLLNNDRRKIELMNGLLFSLPGTPVIYYGDEIGMGDNFYLGDRNGVRTPMQWSADRNAGFSRANPQRLYLPINIDAEYHYEALNVEAQQNNPDSLLWWMKRLIAFRKRHPAFGRGSIEFLYPDNRRVLAFLRRYRGEVILIIANLSRLAQHTSLDLRDFVGRTPVEVFGQADFPPIREAPYPFTLGPYAFYWFALEMRQPETLTVSPTPAEITFPTITRTPVEKAIYGRGRRTTFAAALLNYVRGQRWFGGKARRARSATIRDVITLPHVPRADLVILQIEYTEGEAETYVVPVAFATGKAANIVSTELPQAVIVLLNVGGNGESDGVVYDALYDTAFQSALLKMMSPRHSFPGETGVMMTAPTRRRFRELRGPAVEKLEPTLLKGEQSNTSVVYGNRLKLKLFRRLEEGESPELEIGRFLTEKQPFPHVAPLAGYFEYRPRRQCQPMTLGVLHGYVPNEGDAWHYTLDSLRHYFERVLTHEETEPPLPDGKSLLDISQETVPPAAIEVIGPYFASAQLLGQRTAELHLALAAATDDTTFAPESFSITYQRSVFHAMRGFAIQVLGLLRRQQKNLPGEVQNYAQQVLDRETDIIERLRAITRRRLGAMRIRCHGDYHLGQVLYTGDNFVIIDFEGEPVRHLGERKIKRLPMRDVSGMIRSFNYAAHVALYEQAPKLLRPEDLPALEKWARAWYLWVTAAFLKSYLDLITPTRLLPPDREGLQIILDATLIDKAIYETNYELNNRPDWVRIPLQGILDVLAAASEAFEKTEKKAGE